MAQFISSPQVSSGPDPNSLFDASKVAGNVQNFQNNQLLMQGKQLDLSNANVEQVSRLAAGLINIQDPAARAEAYAKGVGVLQGMGFALHAPATMPDDATLHTLATAGTPSTDLYKLNLGQGAANAAIAGLSPGATAASTATPPATTGTPTTGTAAPSGPAPFVGANLPQGVSPDEDQLVRTVYGEARGEPVAGQQAVASVIKTRMGLGKQGVQDVVFAPNQFEAWSDPKNRPGMEALSPTDPQYQSILNNVVRPVMSGQAQDPTGGATNFYNPALQAQLGRATPSFAQGNQTTIGNHTFFYGGYAPRGAATAAAQPAAVPAGGGGTQPPAPTQFAGPGAPPGSTAAPAPAPDTPWDLPGAPAPDLPPPSTPTAAPAPAYQSPQNGLAPPPTAAAPPPASTAQPAPGQPSTVATVQPTSAPAAVPPMVTASGQAVPGPPQAPALLSNGLTQQQWGIIQGQLRLAGANGPAAVQQVLAQIPTLQNANRQAIQQAYQDAHPDMHFQMTGDGVVVIHPKTGQPVGFIPATPTETPRATTDVQGNTWLLRPGQPPQLLSGNPSGVTGSGPEASALRTMNEVAPKIANGTATPQDLTNYASATEIYRNPTIVENANTGERVRAYTRDLPPGFPPPPGSTAAQQSTTPLPPGPTTSTSAATQPAPSPPPAPNSSQSVVPGIAVGTKKSEEQFGTDFAGGDKKAYDASVGSLGMLANANNAAAVMNSTPGSWTATGPAANTRLELAKTVNGVAGLFGLQPPFDPTKVSAWEALTKQTKLMGMQVVNNYFGGSREAASIINGATSAVPNAENSYLGFRLVSSGIEQDLLRQQQLYEYKAQKVAANQPLSTAETEFNQTHPVEMYTARAIANAIPDDLVAKLQANPSKVADFDQHFGPGIGEFILKGGRTQMVAPAQVPR